MMPPAEAVEAAKEVTAPASALVSRGRRGLVTLLLPAKDEEGAIGATLAALPLETLAMQGFATEVLVVDGRSRDHTAAIARGWGARVVTQRGRGKGAGVREARGAVRGDYVVMLDADCSYATDAIPFIVEALARGEADVVSGSRFRGQRSAGSLRPVNLIGNVLLSTAASVLFLRPCSDVCTGLWGFRAEVFRALPLRSRRFDLEVELFGRCARAGVRWREVPVDYLPRRGGTKLSRTRDGVRIGLRLLRTRFDHPRPSLAAADLAAAAATEGPARWAPVAMAVAPPGFGPDERRRP